MPICSSESKGQMTSVTNDNTICKAGGFICGKVILDLTEEELGDLKGILLDLQRVERVLFAGKQDRVMISVNIQELGPVLTSSCNGKFEFPFKMELQAGLPGSFVVELQQEERYMLSVDYKLSASAIFYHSEEVKGTKAVMMQANVPQGLQKQPDATSKEAAAKCKKIPIALHGDQCEGHVNIGFQCSSSVLAAGCQADLFVFGNNKSGIDIKNLVIQLIELVTIKSTSKPTVVERILFHSKWNVLDHPAWKARSLETKEHMVVPVKVPEKILCESYAGSNFRVEHFIKITAETVDILPTYPSFVDQVYLSLGGHKASLSISQSSQPDDQVLLYEDNDDNDDVPLHQGGSGSSEEMQDPNPAPLSSSVDMGNLVESWKTNQGEVAKLIIAKLHLYHSGKVIIQEEITAVFQSITVLHRIDQSALQATGSSIYTIWSMMEIILMGKHKPHLTQAAMDCLAQLLETETKRDHFEEYSGFHIICDFWTDRILNTTKVETFGETHVKLCRKVLSGEKCQDVLKKLFHASKSCDIKLLAFQEVMELICEGREGRGGSKSQGIKAMAEELLEQKNRFTGSALITIVEQFVRAISTCTERMSYSNCTVIHQPMLPAILFQFLSSATAPLENILLPIVESCVNEKLRADFWIIIMTNLSRLHHQALMNQLLLGVSFDSNGFNIFPFDQCCELFRDKYGPNIVSRNKPFVRQCLVSLAERYPNVVSETLLKDLKHKRNITETGNVFDLDNGINLSALKRAKQPEKVSCFFNCEEPVSYWNWKQDDQGRCPFCGDRIIFKVKHEPWEKLTERQAIYDLRNHHASLETHYNGKCRGGQPWQFYPKQDQLPCAPQNQTIANAIQKCLSRAAKSLGPIPVGLVSEFLNGKADRFLAFLAFYFGYAIRESTCWKRRTKREMVFKRFQKEVNTCLRNILKSTLETTLDDYKARIPVLADKNKCADEKRFLLWNFMMCFFHTDLERHLTEEKYKKKASNFQSSNLGGSPLLQTSTFACPFCKKPDALEACVDALQPPLEWYRVKSNHPVVSHFDGKECSLLWWADFTGKSCRNTGSFYSINDHVQDALCEAAENVPISKDNVKELLDGNARDFRCSLSALFGFAMSYSADAKKLYNIQKRQEKQTNDRKIIHDAFRKFRNTTGGILKKMLSEFMVFDYHCLVNAVPSNRRNQNRKAKSEHLQLWNDLMIFFHKGMYLSVKFPPMEIPEDVAKRDLNYFFMC